MRGRWWIMMALLAVGVLSIIPIRDWLETRGPNTAVTGFIEALKTGDQAAAIWWVHPLHAQALQSAHTVWRPSPRMSFKIGKVEVVGDQAHVDAVLREAGYSLKAAFALEPDQTGRWRITEVTMLDPDPIWEVALQKHERENYARELKAAADRSPGVVVEMDNDSSRR